MLTLKKKKRILNSINLLTFFRCQHLDISENRVTAHLLACLLLPADHLRTLKYLLLFLSDFAVHSEKNKMDTHNIALIIAPNIFVMGAEVR